jgi:type IV secretory pathway component VirB8
MTTTLQYHDHAILRCDATTGHAAVTVALCRDTATARMLVDAYNVQERAQKREQVLREALRKLADLFVQFCRDPEEWKTYNDARAALDALAATEVKP